MSRKKILWLPSWYPNRLSPFNGDFIKRHAEAVSLYDDIQVIYVVRDVRGLVTKNIHIEESEKKGLAEKIIYYYSPQQRVSIVDKYLSGTRYRKIYKEAVTGYINKSGVPSLSHVHVTMKAGVIAQWLKGKRGVPYIISEHWTGLLSEANEKVSDQHFYLRSLWKRTIHGASAFSAVSRYMAVAVQKQFSLQHIHIIPNVVDRDIFSPSLAIENNQRFIHISGLDKFKNPALIIEAFAMVQKKYPLATLDIFGPEDMLLMVLAKKLQAEKNIHFHKEVPQQQLVGYIRQSLALILYSAYETFGCVIIEANACGIPVIVSDIPVFHETVTEGINGVFAEPNNPAALAQKMMGLIENKIFFNSKTIAAESLKYSYEKVGKQFSDWYREVLSNT